MLQLQIKRKYLLSGEKATEDLTKAKVTKGEKYNMKIVVDNIWYSSIYFLMLYATVNTDKWRLNMYPVVKLK